MKVQALAQDVTDSVIPIMCYMGLKDTPKHINLAIILPIEKMKELAYERRRKKQ